MVKGIRLRYTMRTLSIIYIPRASRSRLRALDPRDFALGTSGALRSQNLWRPFYLKILDPPLDRAKELRDFFFYLFLTWLASTQLTTVCIEIKIRKVNKLCP